MRPILRSSRVPASRYSSSHVSRPVAARRLPSRVSSWARCPPPIVLDQSSAMVPSRSLASVEHVLVTARVARSGSVTRASGDIEGVSGPVAVADSGPVSIVISRIVP